MQRELLDTRTWQDQAELGSAIFEWFEALVQPRGRHTALDMLAFHEVERVLPCAATSGMITTPSVSGRSGRPLASRIFGVVVAIKASRTCVGGRDLLARCASHIPAKGA